ncbi:MAG: Lrp/AsnC family transcriptional regulator [Nanoarchaeota archaeon]
MEQNKLHVKDKKIIYQLDLNSRQPNSKIAKKVGLSKDVVNYRIKNLEKLGFIRGYYTIIDFSKLGYFGMRVYLKLFDATPAKEKEIIDYLVKSKKVFFIAEIEGHFDIALGVWIRELYEFEDFYSKFKEKFKLQIGQEQTSIFTKVHHFHRAYLLNKKFDDTKPEVFGKEKIIQHDELDINILKLLCQNSRIPTIEIAQKLKKPARTIAFRIKQLEKKKIIQGYRVIFDFGLLGYNYYKVDLTLKEISRMKELMNFAHAHPNILYVDETIAGSDFEFDLEVENKEKFIEIIEELRTKFSEIRTWSYFTLRRYKKLLYFPET